MDWGGPLDADELDLDGRVPYWFNLLIILWAALAGLGMAGFLMLCYLILSA